MPVGSLQQAISIIVLSPYRIFELIFILYEKLYKYNAIYCTGVFSRGFLEKFVFLVWLPHPTVEKMTANTNVTVTQVHFQNMACCKI